MKETTVRDRRGQRAEPTAPALLEARARTRRPASRSPRRSRRPTGSASAPGRWAPISRTRSRARRSWSSPSGPRTTRTRPATATASGPPTTGSIR